MSVYKFGISALARADGKPRISSMPYEYDIAEGNITGHSIFSKIGYNPDIDTGTESLWKVYRGRQCKRCGTKKPS